MSADRLTAAEMLRDLDFYKLWEIFWGQKLTVLVFLIMSVVLALIYLHQTPYLYTAELKVAPVLTSGSVSSKLGGLSDLASAAGLNIPQDNASMQFRLYVEGITSRPVADELARRTDIMKVLFKKEWDETTHRWVQPPRGIVGQVSSLVKDIVGMPQTAYEPPDGARLEMYLDQRITLERNQKEILATIKYSDEDPAFAIALLSALHAADDGLLRRKALARSAQYVKYLSDKLPTVTLAEHRQAISDVLSDQEKSMMMASAQLAYAAEPFGPPAASFRPTSPQPFIVLAAAVLIGGLAGIIFAFLRAMGLVPNWRLLRWPLREARAGT